MVEVKKVISKKLLISLVATSLTCLLAGYSLATLTTQYKMSNIASIKTIGVNVYRDQNCTDLITQLDWGLLEPATSKTFKVYVKSLSNTPLTLTIFSSNWQPTNCTDYMTLTAEPNNFTLQPSQVAEVNLTLTVASDIQGITNFAFDITFKGVG